MSDVIPCNLCIPDAKSIIRKNYKNYHKAVLKNRSLVKKKSNSRIVASNLPILRKPCCYINNH